MKDRIAADHNSENVICVGVWTVWAGIEKENCWVCFENIHGSQRQYHSVNSEQVKPSIKLKLETKQI